MYKHAFQYYFATWPSDRIHSWNTLTIEWTKNYVYKRLKFLGNKMVSRFLTMAFLALWHGFHSGFYAYFALQFLIIAAEIDVKHFAAKIGLQKKLNYNHHYFLKSILSAMGWILTSIFISQMQLCFHLHHFHHYYPIVRSRGFLCLTLPMVWFITRHLLDLIIKIKHWCSAQPHESCKS